MVRGRIGLLMKSFVKDISFRCTSSREGRVSLITHRWFFWSPDLHTRAGAVDRRRRDELSRDPRLVWLAANIPAGVFLGGLTGIADRFGLRGTTDESK
jgi:hypothetical protein